MSRASPVRRSGAKDAAEPSRSWYEQFDAQYGALLQQRQQQQQPQPALDHAQRALLHTPQRPSAPLRPSRPLSSQSAQKPDRMVGQRRTASNSDNRQLIARQPLPPAPPSAAPRPTSDRRSAGERSPHTSASPTSRRAPSSAPASATGGATEVPAHLRCLLQGEVDQKRRVSAFRQQRAKEKAARDEAERRRKAEHKAKMRAIQDRPLGPSRSAAAPLPSSVSPVPLAAAVPFRYHRPRESEEREGSASPTPPYRLSAPVGDARVDDSACHTRTRSSGSAPLLFPPRRRHPLSHPSSIPSGPSSLASTVVSLPRPSPSQPKPGTPPRALEGRTPTKRGERGELRRVMEQMKQRRGHRGEVDVEVLVPKRGGQGGLRGQGGAEVSAGGQWRRSSGSGCGVQFAASSSCGAEFAVVFASASSSHSASPRASASASEAPLSAHCTDGR